MVKIAPSVMTADFCYLGDTVKMLDNMGADWIHCDVMDGVFVPNISFGMPMIKAMKKLTKKPLDVHLMIHDPSFYQDEFIKCGADIITVHFESPGALHLQRLVAKIKESGIKVGVALNPATNPNVLDYLYDYLDMVLIMSVNPGFGGQKFIPQSLMKIETVANIISKKNLSIEIEVDGGVKIENAKSIKDAGATVLVAGSAVCDAEDPEAVIKILKA
ncbi:MAG: ribulose-phosphate 3-epimerase [Oscillospiraceae bacterium]